MERDRKRTRVESKPGHDRINFLLGPRKPTLTTAEINELHRLIDKTGYATSRPIPTLDEAVDPEEVDEAGLSDKQMRNVVRHLLVKGASQKLSPEEVAKFFRFTKRLCYQPRNPPAQLVRRPVQPTSSRGQNLRYVPPPTEYSDSDSD